jgi:hypothetical protein
MQHLLDFVHEHTLDEQLYCVLPTPLGDLAMQWRRQIDALGWELKPLSDDGPGEYVPRAQLLGRLTSLGANLELFERELRALIAAQVVVAHHLLRDARALLGADIVQDILHGHELFASELSRTVGSLTAPARPALSVVKGGGARSNTRAGHLALVR